MTGGVAESWARLRLVQGDSSAQVWELVASRGQTTLTVGSGPSSSWVIREEGVRPLHFSLHWDGVTLRIADTYGAGDVRVDGASITAQWRSIVGRVRIDFGKAAMVAETSAGAEAEGNHPLEPSPLPPMSAAGPSHEPPAPARVHKATLIGVSPLTAETPVELIDPKNSDSSAPGSRAARPDSERARKATLMGMVVTVPPPAPTPDPEQTSSAAQDEQKPRTPSKGIPSGTLMGVVGPFEARIQRLAAAQPGGNLGQDPGKLSDKRTMLGVPLADLRVGGLSEPPAARPQSEQPPKIVTQAEVRSVSTPPAASFGNERIGSTWQEIPNASRPGPIPMAVLIDPPPDGVPHRQVANDVASRSVPIDARDRNSDVPTQMRDVASLESKRPKRGIPLRYVGIVVLTAAAYCAWLYLLDHL